MGDLPSDDSPDTKLARLLHARARVELPLLQTLLKDARSSRGGNGGSTLAVSLVKQGILSAGEAEQLLAELDGDVAHDSPLMRSEEVQHGWRPGGSVGDYVLLDRIGQGGMGSVFLAEHRQTQARYALKAISLTADEDMLFRFQRECEAMAKLPPHPNIVPVYGYGRGGGCLYLVMDLAGGGDLHERLRTGPLAPDDVVALGLDLARGLAHVHTHGVLHRDLKPANVLFDAEDVPKLVDFGLARMHGGGSSLTKTGDLLGTPAYMAPEQAKGLRAEVDERSDVYGLGTVLYHAVTGRPPFVGQSTLQVLTRVVEEEPPRPSEVRAEVPKPLEAVLLKAMAKKPEGRYQSAAELVQALEPLARASETGSTPRAGLIAGLVALALVSVLLAVAAVLARGRRATPPEETVAAKSVPVKKTTEPAPAPMAQPFSLGAWQLAKGQGFEGVIRFVARAYVNEARVSLETIDVGFSATLDWLGRTAGGATLTFTHFKLRRKNPAVGDAFDSTDESFAAHPFMAIVGGRFKFTMSTRTGQVTQATGLEELQKAVYARMTQEQRTRWMTFRLGFFTKTPMLHALNRVFYVFPKDRAVRRERRWRIDEDVEAFGKEVRREAGGLMMALGLRFKREPNLSKPYIRRFQAPLPTKPGDPSQRIDWVGKGTYRVGKGQVWVEDGRIKRSEGTETTTIELVGGNDPKGTLLKVVNTFEYRELRTH